jgi:transposase
VDVAAARTTWRAEAAGVDPARLIFLDESGFDTRLVRTHARAPHGQRAHGTAPGGHWHRLTLIGALGLDGVCAAMMVAAATSTAVFHAFVTQVLVPALLREPPDAIVVMDNLAAHKAALVRKAFDQAGISYRYLPAYSPDMNPIEQAWSKLKTHLRARAVRTQDALERAIPAALRTITPRNAQGWFRHAGYAPN